MDRKTILILAGSLVLMLGYSSLINRLYPPVPVPAATNSVTAAGAPVTNAASQAQPTASPTTPPPGISAATTAWSLPTQGPETTLSLEAGPARYQFTSRGGGLRQVELLRYPERVNGSKQSSSTNVATLNQLALVPVFAILGGAELVGDGVFALTPTPGGVRAEKELPGGLHLVKEFRPGTNYLMSVTVRFENRGTQPLKLPTQEQVVGTAMGMGPGDDETLVEVQWSNGKGSERVGEPWFANRTLGCFPGTPRDTYLAGQNNVHWAAANNRFFAMVTFPPSNAPAAMISARRLPPLTAAEIAADPLAPTNRFRFQTALVYPEAVLAAGQTIERRYEVFTGPKEYKTLDRIASRFGNDVEQVMGFGGFFGFFAKVLLLSMNAVHSTTHLSYALCIIVITVIIKLLFWPLTQMSTRSMKRMAELQPQMKALQEKYKDEPKKYQQKLGEFMRENKVNPAAGCLPILIQLPVFMGFYTMLRSAIELRGASFLWANDLSMPDTIFLLPGLGFPVNPLPLLMAATQIWQMRLTPPSPGVDPMQQKMMQYMPLIFVVVLYNFSSGLTLYWTVQNLLTIAQMKLTKSSSGKPAAAPVAPAAQPPRRRRR